jgi:hypothetical protein
LGTASYCGNTQQLTAAVKLLNCYDDLLVDLGCAEEVSTRESFDTKWPYDTYIWTNRGLYMPEPNSLDALSAAADAVLDELGAPIEEIDLKPRWDSERRELWLGERLVKQYRQRAANQVQILSAFEEENWPGRIDNPIRPKVNTDENDTARRLSEAVRRLNDNDYIRFERDGTGEGILWQLTRRP